MPLSKPSPKTRVFFFSHPRTASNLLVKLLSDQNGWSYNDYNFHPAYQYAIRNLNLGDPSKTLPDIYAQYLEQIGRAFENLESFLSTAEQDGDHAFARDHALMLLRPETIFPGLPRTLLLSSSASTHTNPTFLPDSVLQKFTPLFLIRHPAAVFESWFRLQTTFENPSLAYSLIPQMRIYQWYKQHTSITPIVLDADDVIERPETLEKVCEILGMRVEDVQREWEVMEEETVLKLGERKKIFLGTFIGSNGVLAGKSSRGLDLEVKKGEWKEDFGSERMEWLVERVEEAMGDYEFLRGVRVV